MTLFTCCIMFLLFVVVCQLDELTASTVSPAEGRGDGKTIVCYFTNWAWYRKEVGKYTPDNIDPTLCTHIIYAFASLNAGTNTISVYDPWTDIDNHFYAKVTALRSQGVKVLIAIGGWNDSTGKWNTMMSSADLRTRFVESVLKFLTKYGFDGLDVDYEYPGCPQGARSAESQTNAKNFNQLIKELRDAFGKNYLLTLATSAGNSNLQKCYYDVGSLCQLVDWMNLMAYDYHSHLEGKVGANAPFAKTGDSWGVYDSINYFLNDLKCPADKLVLGVPFYGQTYTLADKNKHEWGAPSTGGGTAGPFTVSAGYLAYYEICQNIAQEKWTAGFDAVNSAFAYSGDQFVSYDSVQALELKMALVHKRGLRGVMIWDLDYDDFTGECCKCGKYPLLKTVNNHLLGTAYQVNCSRLSMSISKSSISAKLDSVTLYQITTTSNNLIFSIFTFNPFIRLFRLNP